MVLSCRKAQTGLKTKTVYLIAVLALLIILTLIVMGILPKLYRTLVP